MTVERILRFIFALCLHFVVLSYRESSDRIRERFQIIQFLCVCVCVINVKDGVFATSKWLRTKQLVDLSFVSKHG